MLSQLTVPDLIALGWFFAAWVVHGLLVERGWFGLVSLNAHMYQVRRVWMRNLLRRENRIMDSQLIGHLITSVAFFASTTTLMLAGVLGVLASAENAHAVVVDLGYTMTTSRAQFEMKVLMIGGVFIYAFFAFTWSLRQFNYSLALMGAAPLEHAPEMDALADHAAQVMSLAVRAFNSGIRCYYYAFASLGWFVSPWVFMGFVTLVTAVLLLRQFGSRAMSSVRHFSAVTRLPE
ncbi:DUF599 domain-containing protein [Indioceanicola profundi]|uniref:DUF599 domain-containing protein n=1 Tax=Indioceanicola profundi TaxID=2220096 RepID=UPI000E6AAFEA|nr:DUF599 family protein [Indioceanicola profundi]